MSDREAPPPEDGRRADLRGVVMEHTRTQPPATDDSRLAPKTSRVGKRPIDAAEGGHRRRSTAGKVEVEGPEGAALPSAHRARWTSSSRAASSTSSSARPGPRRLAPPGPHARARRRAWSRARPRATSGSLELKGTGYRVELKGTTLNFALGFSHPVDVPAADGASRRRSRRTRRAPSSSSTGADKELIGQTAAKIRGFRPPEPYGGKGVRYRGERVREKAGKAGKGGKK